MCNHEFTRLDSLQRHHRESESCGNKRDSENMTPLAPPAKRVALRERDLNLIGSEARNGVIGYFEHQTRPSGMPQFDDTVGIGNGEVFSRFIECDGPRRFADSTKLRRRYMSKHDIIPDKEPRGGQTPAKRKDGRH